MLFVIDIGNSHTVIGLYDNDDLKSHWRITSNRHQTPDEIAIQFNALFTMAGMGRLSISGIIVSSVVPSLEAAWLACCTKHFSNNLKTPPIVVNDKSLQNIIHIKTDYPGEVGADRLVNAIAAWSQYQSHLIVIDFGTAITFDCVTDKCEYIGGTILPGIAISLEALSSRAAKLPHIDISTAPAAIIGKNTVDAMKSGILNGYGAMIDGLVRILGEEMCTNGQNLTVLATGGMAGLIIPYCKDVSIIDQMLTLKGLRLIYTRIQSQG
ncbi:MAG: type III pantothenate kinase [Desulfopila sp.]|jgi:type III pantothenate kinase|nr:type III pantothenate kinase [Desulfopila sp.]